jgi:hypothetical protein
MKKKEETSEVPEVIAPVETEKEHLLKLLQELLDRGIHSLSDLENQIARL